jgi:hypothetical protein
MPIYSFGADSPLKFELSEDFADAYNRALKAFFEAQTYYKTKFRTPWEPSQALEMYVKKEDIDVFNAFGDILDKALDDYGADVSEEELTNDYLIKN